MILGGQYPIIRVDSVLWRKCGGLAIGLLVKTTLEKGDLLPLLMSLQKVSYTIQPASTLLQDINLELLGTVGSLADPRAAEIYSSQGYGRVGTAFMEADCRGRLSSLVKNEAVDPSRFIPVAEWFQDPESQLVTTRVDQNCFRQKMWLCPALCR